MKAHQFYKGQRVQSLKAVDVGGGRMLPARTKFQVTDIILRHKSETIKFEDGINEFPGRVQFKLVDAEKPDPFKPGKPASRVFNFVEEKAGEDFPFVEIKKSSQ